MSDKPPIRIKDLYPDFTDEQLAEAETKLRRFARVLAKIYKERNGADEDLTAGCGSPTIPSERSKPQ
jgi:hypothetical protein